MYNDKEKVPGAGNYDIKSQAFTNKSRFHMGIKLHELTKLNVPGSGSYNTENSAIKKSASAFSMGTKLKGGALDQNK